jgi:hypothetical protein
MEVEMTTKQMVVGGEETGIRPKGYRLPESTHLGRVRLQVADLERSIQDLKIQRKSTRNKVQGTIDTVQQLLMLDAEEEANELPITAMFRAQKSS